MARINASKRVRVIRGKNSLSQRGDKDIKIEKWNKILRECMR